MKNLIDHFNDNLVPYELAKLNGGKLLWSADRKTLSEYDINGSNEQSLLERFAYVTLEDPFFEKLGVNPEDKITAYAERYGGHGVGKHGGGARSWVKGMIQVKGSGVNCMLGRDMDYLHNNGHLSIVDAIQELTISFVLRDILPHGVADYLCLIYTDKNGSIKENFQTGIPEPCGGALLVRQSLVRPANFFPSIGFRDDVKRDDRFVSDMSRMRAVGKKLANEFPSIALFTIFINNVIRTHAEQFACARASGLAHGAVSHSNLSLSGKWIDITSASFLPGATNYLMGGASQVPFYSEVNEVWDALKHFIYVYSKYSRHNIDIDMFKDIFMAHYHKCVQSYAGLALGFSEREITRLKNVEEYACLTKIILDCINSGKEVIHEAPSSLPLGDRLLTTLKLMYDPILYRISQSQDKGVKDLNAGSEALSTCLQMIFREDDGWAFNNFIMSKWLTAIKRGHMREIFFMSRNRDTIRKIEEESDCTGLIQYIQEAESTSKWIWSSIDNGAVKILGSRDIDILFDVKLGVCVSVDKLENKQSRQFNLSELNKNIDSRALDIMGCSIEHYVDAVVGEGPSI